MKKILYIVVPCYNEEEVLKETAKRLTKKLNELIKLNVITKSSRILFVNDGSKDKTWEIIKDLDCKEELCTGISLSRNRGHQNALLAGLLHAKEKADIIISMDADLQDDVDAIDEMLKKYSEGSEIVYGVRKSRKKDSFFKRITAQGFYKFMKRMGVDIVYNHADYRLTSKRVLNHFADYKEVNLFLRGMFPLLGFKTDIVYYERSERFAGKSKYSFKKMLDFAWEGITSFSTRPLRFILNFGVFITMLSIIGLIALLVLYLVNVVYPTWVIIIGFIALFAGIEITFMGIIGEYIGKIYSETKARPRYIISEDLEEQK